MDSSEMALPTPSQELLGSNSAIGALSAAPLTLAVGASSSYRTIDNLASRRLQTSQQSMNRACVTVKATSPGGTDLIGDDQAAGGFDLVVVQKSGEVQPETQVSVKPQQPFQQQAVIPGEPSNLFQPKPIRAILRNPLMSSATMSSDNQTPSEPFTAKQSTATSGEFSTSFNFNVLSVATTPAPKRTVGYDSSAKRNSDGKLINFDVYSLVDSHAIAP